MAWGETTGPTLDEQRQRRLERSVAQLLHALDDWQENRSTANADMVLAWRDLVRETLNRTDSPRDRPVQVYPAR